MSGCGKSKATRVVQPSRSSDERLSWIQPAEKERAEAHALVLAKTLNMLRKKEALCDVKFSVKDENGKQILLPAHKCVLVSASGYFREIVGVSDLDFEEKISEEQKPQVTMGSPGRVSNASGHGVFVFPFAISSKALETVLEHCYLGTVDVDVDTVEPVIDLAAKLAIPALERDCAKALKAKYTPEKLEKLYHLSRKIKSLELRHFALDNAMKNFDKFVNSDLFQELTAEEIQEFINHRTVTSMRRLPSELQHFNAIMKWYRQDPFDREKLAREMLSNLRYEKLPPNDLLEVVLQNELVAGDRELRDMVESSARDNKKAILNQASRGTGSYRKSTGSFSALLVIGGCHFDQLTSKIERLSEYKWNWSEWGQIPTPTAHHCVAVVDHVLYVVGGETAVLGGMKRLNTVWSFSQRTLEWTSLTPLQQARSHFYLGVWENHLIAVAGRGEKSIHASVEKFNLDTKKWEYTQFLPQECFNHAGCDLKGELYITGGEVKQSSTNELLRFNPDAHRWHKMSPMKCARSNHCMAAARNKFLVFGGEKVTMEISHPVVSAIECYCCANNNWHTVERKIDFYGLVDCACATLKGRICFVGGCHNNASEYRQYVTTYDAECDLWSSLPNLPRRIRGCACAVVKVDSVM